VLFPPTPREEDGSLDDLVYWLRAVERFLEAATNGWINKKEWIYWCCVFESIPVVSSHFATLLPEALRARRLRREHAKARAAEREKLELAKAIGTVPANAWGQWVLLGAEWRWQDHYARFAAPWPVQSSVRCGPCVLPVCRY
jgi:hypothetical protein